MKYILATCFIVLAFTIYFMCDYVDDQEFYAIDRGQYLPGSHYED